MLPFSAWLNILTALMALGTAIYELMDVRCAPLHRKFVRMAKGVLMLYFFGFYIYATWGPTSYWVRIGLYSKVGLILIFFVMVIDQWVLRQAQKRGNGCQPS